MITGVIMSGILVGMACEVGAEQWNGPDNAKGTIWRPGNVKVGGQPQGQDSGTALIEVQQDMTGTRDLLFSAKATFKGNTSSILEVDTKGVYVGGATTRVSLLPSGSYDLAIGRGLVVGLSSVTDRVPSGYSLVVGGKVLAEEVRVKQISEWADYVFRPDYPLTPLSDVRDYIAAHHHLPDVPSASEVAENGIGLGKMQATLLRKIEELTLHMIQQNDTITTLQLELAELKGNTRPKLK